MNAPADSDPRSGETSTRDHYRKALEDTIQEDNFSADATRARVARFARRESEARRSISVTSGTHDSVSARDPDFRPIITRLQSPGKRNDSTKRYELGAVLGRGGSGQIFAARDLTLGRDVAIKVLYPDIASNPARLERFINEAQITAKLEHPYILPVYDLEIPENGDAYFSMRVANGLSLGEALRKAAAEESPPVQIATVRDRITVFLKVLDALAFAHSRGVIHQDIKPDNIMLGNFGEVLVVDWGTAIAREGRDGRAERLIGTPAYMAPEQARRERADERSDVYGLGATFFQMLTLRHPTWESDPDAFWTKKREGIVDPPTAEERARVPGPLLDLTLKAIAADPAERYQSVDEFRAALHEYLQHAESITLQVSAQESLADGMRTQEYTRFNQALFGFQEALKLWPENAHAARGISETQLRYSECALAKDDLELAASMLNPDDPEHSAMRQRVAEARARRNVVRRRVRQVQAAAALLAVVLIAFVGYYTIDYFRYFGQWKVVYNQDFTQPTADVHSIFMSSGTDWNKEESPAPRSSAGLALTQGPVYWLRDLQLHGDIRIEAQITWPGWVDGFELYINTSRTQETNGFVSPAGHVCQFGGYANTLNFIAPQDHCRTISRAGAVGYEFKPGQSYRLAFEREGEELSIWVDGREIHRQLLLLPVTRTGFNSLGFRCWSNVNLQKLTVSRKTIPEKSSPLVAGDALYVDGHYEEALRVYRELATDFSGSRIGEQALARAYLMTYAHAEVPNVGDLRATLKKEMLEHYPHSAYWSEILDADCVASWRARHYSDALSELSVIFQRNPDTRIVLRLLEEPHSELPDNVAQSILGWARQTRNVQYLYLNGYGLTTLGPLAGMQLTRIDCANNLITSLQPLQGMPLKALDCSENLLPDLEPLRGMQLTQLHCHDNKLTSLDPLKGMPLKYLNCWNNAVEKIDALKGMPLDRLEIGNNHIADLAPLSAMQLKVLEVSTNAVKNLEPLKGQPLSQLEIIHNEIATLEPLRGMKLTRLCCSNNPIDTLAPLAGMPLRVLEAGGCKLTNLEPLRGCPLFELNVPDNTISNLEPLRGMKLNTLNAANNPLSDLSPLKGMPLTALDINTTRVSSIEPLRGTSIANLKIFRTNISDLAPVGSDARLSRLEMMDTPVHNLDVFTGKPPDVIASWENWSAAEFDALMSKWTAAGNPPLLAGRERATRLFRTRQFDKLKTMAREFRGHHYLLIPIHMQYDEANTLAQSAGGHLVTITSAEEQTFLISLLQNSEDFWLGMTSGPKGEAWITGEPMTFHNEDAFILRSRPGHRGLFSYVKDGLWHVFPDDTLLLTMIEWDN